MGGGKRIQQMSNGLSLANNMLFTRKSPRPGSEFFIRFEKVFSMILISAC